MPRWPPTRALWRTSHVRLLARPSRSHRPGVVDAVVVPIYRPPRFIRSSAALAAELGCPLLALCSGRAEPTAVAAEMQPADGVAVGMPAEADLTLPGLATLQAAPERPFTYVDRARKRNTGLLAARLLGWRRVLFLDDDVTDLAPIVFRAAAGRQAASFERVIAWRAPRFPDNSVVSHALRAAGGEQDVFVGAGTYLVNIRQTPPFFPATFNEDWLFFHDSLREGVLGLGGDVRQEPFNPFADPDRARREEFGDVLGEGLYALVHERRPVAAALDADHWRRILAERRDMLAWITTELLASRPGCPGPLPRDAHVDQVLACLAAAGKELAELRPEQLAGFVRDWRQDLLVWRRAWSGLPRLGTLVEALAHLGLTDVHPAAR